MVLVGQFEQRAGLAGRVQSVPLDLMVGGGQHHLVGPDRVDPATQFGLGAQSVTIGDGHTHR